MNCPEGYVLSGGVCVADASEGSGGVPIAPLISPAVTLTAAQINGMFAAPVLVIPGVPNMLIRIVSVTLNAIYGGASFVGGGNIGIYYGNVSPAVSQASSNTCPVAFLTGLAANQIAGIANALVALPFTLTSAAIGAGGYLSNVAGPFTGGAGASMIVNCLYYLIPGAQ